MCQTVLILIVSGLLRMYLFVLYLALKSVRIWRIKEKWILMTIKDEKLLGLIQLGNALLNTLLVVHILACCWHGK